MKFLNIIKSVGENYILAMVKKIAKLKILRTPVFGSKRLEIENISFRSIFDHLLCYLHLIDSVLANEFDEI